MFWAQGMLVEWPPLGHNSFHRIVSYGLAFTVYKANILVGGLAGEKSRTKAMQLKNFLNNINIQ